MRKFPLWAIWALPALPFLTLIGFLLWHTTVPHRAWRAWVLSVSALGTTLLAILVSVIAILVSLLLAGHQKGWLSMRRRWQQRIRDGVLFGVLVLWSAVFLWHFIFLPPETFSVDEIARFAQGIVVVRGSANEVSMLVGTGFWADERGYAFICRDPEESDADRSAVKVGMITMPPLLTGKLMALATGIMYGPGQLVYDDPETGIKLVYVENNPFTRKFHGFAEAEDINSGEVERSVEEYWVPQLSAQNVNVGDPLFLAGIELREKDTLAMSTVEGRVVGLWPSLSSPKRFLRISTSLPFKPSYCGAPVLSATKLIVGMVACVPGSTAVVIPVQYLKYLTDTLLETGLMTRTHE